MYAAFKLAIRSLRRTPGFTALALVILALGIGATTAMFTITRTILSKPLAYRNPQQLVNLMLHVPAYAQFADQVPLNAWHYRIFSQRSRTLSGIALIGPDSKILSGAGSPASIQGVHVTANFFSLIGLQPRLGRGFLPGEDRAERTRKL